MSKKSILITGASSGLGRTTALYLQKHGFYVFAAAREIQGVFNDVTDIQELTLDITSEQSISDAFKEIKLKQDKYPLWGLINNAGICIPGPLEILNAGELRKQLDTNVIGQLSITQASLPFIRANKGRIINITSGLGSIAVPYLGAYSIAQFAKMAFTDALRRELRNSGISVSVVQPGAIYTPIWGKFINAGKLALTKTKNPAKKTYQRSFNEFLNTSETQARLSKTTDRDFSKIILEILKTEVPKSHYYVGDDAKLFIETSKKSMPNQIDDLFSNQIPTSSEF